MLVHLTARTCGREPVLSVHSVAAWLWRALRHGFPDSLAAVLMPNHVHVVTAVRWTDVARVRLARILGACSRRCRGSRPDPTHWEPVPPPTVITDPSHLRRHVRYVAMNPCRARLARDPLEWLWSTHRDVVGAVADPWVTAKRLAHALDLPARGFADAFHRYVSGDPSCDVRGTQPPRPAAPAEHARYPLQRVCDAAVAATSALPSAVRARTATRAAFVLLAAHQGWRDPSALARFCGVTRRAIYHLLGRDDEALLAAAALCLGDDRLLGAR